jgi:hypothetical protein
MGCWSQENNSCSNSALYGYVNICLPKIKGMTECRSHPKVQQVIRNYLVSGPVLGYYLNNATYKQIDKFGEIANDNYFMIYGDYQRENYHASETDLDIAQRNLEQTLFEDESFKQISSRVEDVYGTITAGKPVLLEKYSPRPNVKTMIMLMKYQTESDETSIVSAVDLILVKNRIINLAYYCTYNGGKSIDILKQMNNEALEKLLNIN